MKCVYRFKVEGNLSLTEKRTIQIRNVVYEFETDKDLLKYIQVTSILSNSDEWPKIAPSLEPGVKFTLKISAPTLSVIQMELRAVEAALSLFGIRSIDIDFPEIQWIPENESETDILRVFKYKEKLAPSAQAFPMRFDVLARSIIAATDFLDTELPLSFFRHGTNAFEQKRYIEAIYQFYFLLETLFGNGKTKNKAVKLEFRKSVPLLKAIETFYRFIENSSNEVKMELSEKFNRKD